MKSGKARSRFAESLARLLDETNLFKRSQWAEFLSVTPAALSQWVNDVTIPKPDRLYMIFEVLRQSDGVPAEVLDAFRETAQARSTQVSPHGRRMLPTVWDYMMRPAFGDLANRLAKLPPVEQERVLADTFPAPLDDRAAALSLAPAATQSTWKYDVAISYAAPDEHLVLSFKDWLSQDCGMGVWCPERALRPEDRWQDTFLEAVASSRSLLVCVGPSGEVGGWPADGSDLPSGFAQVAECNIVGVLLPGAGSAVPLPEALHAIPWIDFRGGFSSPSELAALLTAIGDAPASPVHTRPRDPAPASQEAWRLTLLDTIESAIPHARPGLSTAYFTRAVLDVITASVRNYLEADYATILVERADSRGRFLLTVSRSARDPGRAMHGTDTVIRRRAAGRVDATGGAEDDKTPSADGAADRQFPMGLTWQAVDKKSPLLVDDVKDPRWSRSFIACYPGIRSEIVVPVFPQRSEHTVTSWSAAPGEESPEPGETRTAPGEVAAVLNVESVQPRHFSEMDRRACEGVAQKILAAQRHAVLQIMSLERLAEAAVAADDLWPRASAGRGAAGDHRPRLIAALRDFVTMVCPSRSVNVVLIPDGAEPNSALLTACRRGRPLFVRSHCLNWIDKVRLAGNSHVCIGVVPLPGPPGVLDIAQVTGPAEDEGDVLLAFYLLAHGITAAMDRCRTSYPHTPDGRCGWPAHRPDAELPTPDALDARGRLYTMLIDNQIRADELTYYSSIVNKNVTRAQKTGRISLGDLVPAVAFREVWPLEQPYPTPLRAYHRPEGIDHVPRKTDPDLAKWLLDCMMDHEGPEGPQPVSVLLVGDSKSDVALAENLARCEPAGPQTISLLLMNRDRQLGGSQAGGPSVARIDLYQNWQALETAGIARMRGHSPVRRQLKYLLLDIDRTTIMPRGLCDEALETAKEMAVNSFVTRLLGETRADHDARIREAHLASAHFPPYMESDDEDARCLATLLVAVGLVKAELWTPRHCPVKDRRSLIQWLDWAVAEAKAKAMETRDTIPNYDFFMAFLNEVRNRIRSKVATFLPEYRRDEEEAFRHLSKIGQYRINGHIVNLVAEATALGWIPIGYSDRPSASVGLELYTDYRARPRLIPPALIDIEAGCELEPPPDGLPG